MIFKKNIQIKMVRGFTLLELLVALSIFSVLSVMAYGGLQTVITTKQSTQKSSERIADIQLVMMRISSDLRQAVSRNIRDVYGDPLHAMQSSNNGDETVAWTRAGYRNPARLKRSHIQRVAYNVEQQKLFRLTWPVLDQAQDTEVIKTEILSNIESMEWRFLDSHTEWITSWPEEDAKVGSQSLPKAVEITFDLQEWGKIRRLILLANGS